MDKPTRLYKYEPASAQALENLKNQVIYFGSPVQFNDPFDCALNPSIKEPSEADVERIRSYYLAREDLGARARVEFETTSQVGLRALLLKMGRDVLDKEIQRFVAQRGVSCFAERPDSLLLWSHYASHHRGFCLEFRTDMDPFAKVRKVSYSEKMPEFDLVTMLCDREFEQILDLYYTKALDWEYEREWRCIHSEARTAFTYAAEALTGVFFGARSSFTSFEIAALILQGQNEHVQLWQGKRSNSAFTVKFDPVSYTPNLEAKRQGRTK